MLIHPCGRRRWMGSLRLAGHARSNPSALPCIKPARYTMDLPTNGCSRLSTRSMKHLPTILASAAFFVLVSVSAADDGDGIDFFETKLRPVLVEHCFACHSK